MTAKTTTEAATLSVNGQTLDLPVILGTEREKALDITKLRDATGCITIDPGFGNTGACTSAITFLNGERGVLRYRGIPIEQLAESATFTETAYLLIYGNLPSQREMEQFSARLTERAALPEGMERHFELFPKTAHPMAVLSAMVTILSNYYPALLNPYPTREEMDEAILTILAKVPTLAAYGYRRSQGLPIVAPRRDLSYTANYLHMIFGSPGADKTPDATIVQAMRQIFILHADHEQNCSTSTVRLVGSSRANAFSSVASGISALWGPLHGGANQAVIEMLEAIQRDGGDYKKYVALAKDKTSTFRLMGFGHRVYKNFDPRSRIIKSACDQVLATLGVRDPLLDIAKHLEEAALKDDYFIARKLYPNVDFYSGIILRAIGIPTNGFTVTFALGRLPGWLAHWKEMLESPGMRIGRPRQVYVGPTERKYVALSQRG
ncbi:MAG: citrate (Si)-synthase [Omnitrophica WOR_2 bacterium RIFCSPHIGHO2_02_FULL_68_15]|nr:MAG: citrate (Si)-synthase [Omnitrophica WOR_2 bacterium RIFCSPHIGHO2_02_FULL_68_15]